jgi:hypothetical protein
MQDLDSFISPIPRFEGDILIPAILISALNPGGESSKDPSVRSNAGASKTQASKRKEPIDPSPQKRPRKLPGNL